MATGRVLIYTVRKTGDDAAIMDQMILDGTFTYTGSYTSNVVINKADIANTPNDVFICKYFWASGEGPNLGSVTIISQTVQAKTDINVVFPETFG